MGPGRGITFEIHALHEFRILAENRPQGRDDTARGERIEGLATQVGKAPAIEILQIEQRIHHMSELVDPVSLRPRRRLSIQEAAVGFHLSSE